MNRLCRTALVVAVAGQTVAAPVVRIACEYVRPMTAAVQRLSNALLTSPRWGFSVDRIAGSAELRINPLARSAT